MELAQNHQWGAQYSRLFSFCDLSRVRNFVVKRMTDVHFLEVWFFRCVAIRQSSVLATSPVQATRNAPGVTALRWQSLCMTLGSGRPSMQGTSRRRFRK